MAADGMQAPAIYVSALQGIGAVVCIQQPLPETEIETA